jgi:PAS domain S-box-containing protein
MIGDTTVQRQMFEPPVSPLELLHGVRAGVLVVDRARQILFVNQWLAEQVGCPATSLLGNTPDSLWADEAGTQTAEILDAVFATGQSAVWHVTMPLDGQSRAFECHASPMQQEGTVVAAQVSCLDISTYLENARFYETQRRRAARFEAIRDVGQHIASFLDRRELLNRTVELICSRFGYARVHLWLKQEDAEVLKLEATAPDKLEAADGTVVLDLSAQDERLAQSTVGWVARQSQSLLVNEIESQGDYLSRRNSGPQWDSGAELAVPIVRGSQVLGVLDVWQEEPGAFDESDSFVLESLSNQIAVAIENAQLYDAVSQRLAEVSTLYMLANQVSSSLDLNVVLDSVMDILKRVLDCRGGCIFLLDDEGEWLEMRASSGIKPYWQREARMRIGEGISGQVAQTARSVYIPDTQRDPGFLMFDPAVRSLLVVPLIFKGQVIGTLNVDDDKPNVFSQDVTRLLSIAAAQAAAAIQTAKLYTELKERAERLTQAHRELQESDRLRTQFVQNMSHELRTPLTFVRGYVDLLLEGTLGPLNDRQSQSLQIVADRTRKVIDLVNDILSLQLVERGELNFATVSLAEIAHACVQSAHATAKEEGLALVEEFELDLPLVWGDRSRLDQVFANLIQNAIKFSPDGGTITVRLCSEPEGVRVDVTDQGIGIPEDQLTRIFERFYQVDGSSKRRFGGTGLGLTIVQEIVQAHGGTIGVQSRLDEGSTFSFTIPFAPSQPE